MVRADVEVPLPHLPLRITWLRTSCLLLEYGEWSALTDPFFQPKMWGMRARDPGMTMDALPHIDAILASHLHRDHFDLDSVREIAHPDLEIVGTVGTADFCADLDVKAVHDLPPWESCEVGPCKVLAAPAIHTGPPPPEVNLIAQLGELTVFFGGDCNWSPAFSTIAERVGGVDIALVPVGGTRIFGSRVTMNPTLAAKACAELGARFAIPIHEGGEWPSLPPASLHPGRCTDLVDALRRHAPNCAPCVLGRGEAAVFTPRRVRFPGLRRDLPSGVLD